MKEILTCFLELGFFLWRFMVVQVVLEYEVVSFSSNVHDAQINQPNMELGDFNRFFLIK